LHVLNSKVHNGKYRDYCHNGGNGIHAGCVIVGHKKVGKRIKKGRNTLVIRQLSEAILTRLCKSTRIGGIPLRLMNKEKLKANGKSSVDRKLNRIINWIGSGQSLVFHTILFAGSFCLTFFGIDFEKILLVVTTIVSLEAIYLAIFIQMAVNLNTKSLDAVEEDIDEIQEDVEEIQKDVDEIEKDVDDIQEDVDGIEKDIDEIQKDVDVIERDETKDQMLDAKSTAVLHKIEERLVKLTSQIEKIKHDHQ
jgi:methyl-accepting chemotaxis protein